MRHHGRRAEPRKTHGPLLMGRNSLREIVLHKPECIGRVYISAKLKGAHSDDLLSLLQSRGIKCEFVEPIQLTQMAGSDSHQSFIAELKERRPSDFKELLAWSEKADKALFLFLDGVTDPQNLGAILRAAECFGVDAIVWAKDRSAAITPAVTKASVGASELVRSVVVPNLAESIKRMSQTGVWFLAAELSERSENLHKVALPAKSAFVLGAEGEGIRRLVREKCEMAVKIPLYGKISSLNVSQSCSVLLNAYRAQHG